MKLNQVLAIEKSVKDKAHSVLTQAHHRVQAAQLLSGISRKYEPVDDDGEQFPPESQLVQVRASEAIQEASDALSALFDVSLQKDAANTEASADVVLDDGTKILEKVPPTYLLWLEKKLVDIHTFVSKLPALPADEEWEFDANTNCYRSKERKTAKTKKVPKPFVKYEATKEHPAQVEVVAEDILQGYWSTVKFSGALPASRISTILSRVEKLQRAVKTAREQANLQETKRQQVGEKVFGYLFA